MQPDKPDVRIDEDQEWAEDTRTLVQMDLPTYTKTLPDGRPLTQAHLQPGDHVMVYAGDWPDDMVSGKVIEVETRTRVLVRYEDGDINTSGWVSARRITSVHRPLTK